MKILHFIKWYLNPYYWWKPYFVSFIEEAIFNPKYSGYAAGRMEVYSQWSHYDIDEIRFFTKDKEFYKFREKWDFKNITRKQLKEVIKICESYQDEID